MAAIQRPNPIRDLRQVFPRNGFPVQNMGGLPRTPTAAPPKPFVTQPTVSAGPPGPAPMLGQPILNATAPGATPLPGPRVPTPAPAPAAPTGAPAPQPAPSPGPSSPPTATPGSRGAAPAQGDLEQQIRDYLTGAFKGSVTPEFIQRAKEQVFRNVSGQTSQASNRINEDAIRRGLFRSGIPAEGIANVEAAGQGAMASGVADILNAAEAQNIQGRQAAAGTAGELLSANRSWQQYQDAQK
ncbi:MAG: hypothetical protein ACM369_08745, partial [Acidobacteriota bacterium]